MALDMGEFCRRSKRFMVPVQVAKPSKLSQYSVALTSYDILVQCRVATANVPYIALEVLHIDWVEADDSSVKSHISFCETITIIKWCSILGEMLLGTVQRLEESCYILFVCLLGAENGQYDLVVGETQLLRCKT